LPGLLRGAVTDREYESLSTLLDVTDLSALTLVYLEQCLADEEFTDWDGLIEFLLQQPRRRSRSTIQSWQS
jgi:hypothetical protein